MFCFIAKHLFPVVGGIVFLFMIFVCMCYAFPETMFKFADWILGIKDRIAKHFDPNTKTCDKCGYKGNEELITWEMFQDSDKIKRFFVKVRYMQCSHTQIICSDCFYRGK